MVMGDNSKIVGAYFIGGVAIGGDAIGTRDDHVNFTLRHQVSGHRVAHECASHVVLQQLPHCQLRALVARTSFINIDMDIFARLYRRANDTKSGAPAARGQRPGVAVRNNIRSLRHELCAELTQYFIGRDVIFQDLTGKLDRRF